jgi:LacI family transcriptional regulator
VVSYVVNNGPRPVAPQTRQRVLAAIADIGYRPNGIAKSLAAGSTRTFGLVVPDISNPFFSAMAHAIEDELFAAGMVLLLGDSAESREREGEILTSLQQNQVDGLLLVGTDNHPRVQALVEQGTPVVVLDRIADDSPAASVTIDNESAAYEATRHLIEHGYTTIGIVAGPHELSTARDRTRGWSSALAEAGLKRRDAWFREAAFSKAAGFAVGQEIFAGGKLPRAFFVANDQQAVGILRAAHEAGVRVPEDVAIVTFDGTDDSLYSVPPLSTVRQPIDEIARIAVAMLLNPDSFTTNRVTCEFELVIRRSCGCAATAD